MSSANQSAPFEKYSSEWNTVMRLYTRTSMLNFIRYFFKETERKKFKVSRHHIAVCDALDKVVRGEIVKLIINIAPRYGKTEMSIKKFIPYCLSLSPSAKFIHLSYSNELAWDNSEAAKDLIIHERYQQLFPEVKLSSDSTAKKKWYTTQGGGVYATSSGGQVTGFGAGAVDLSEDEEAATLDNFLDSLGIDSLFGGALLIDDAMKPEDADSIIKSARINNRWDTTFKNRVNSRRTPIIVMGQRVGPSDFVQHLLDTEPGEWTVVSLPAIWEDESGIEHALWDDKHTLAELYKMQEQDPVSFGRQYMQNPQPPAGFMYGTFKLYSIIPPSQRRYVKNYTDTADEGKDYLCSISYVETETAIYVLDVLYTQKAQETTEPETAQQLLNNGVQVALIESNNGGRGFARKVESLLRLQRNLSTKIKWFHQSGNKVARISTNSASVINMIHMPVGWESMWPQFHKAVTTYMRVGKNAFDDAPDVLSGMIEHFGKGFTKFGGVDNS